MRINSQLSLINNRLVVAYDEDEEDFFTAEIPLSALTTRREYLINLVEEISKNIAPDRLVAIKEWEGTPESAAHLHPFASDEEELNDVLKELSMIDRKILLSKDDKIAKELTTEARKDLPTSEFVFPKDRRYPIQNKSHAQNALARVEQHGTPAEKAKVKREVKKKYPDMEVSK